MCVCVCVCERENQARKDEKKDKKTEKLDETKDEKKGKEEPQGARTFPREAEALALTLFAMFDSDNSGTLGTAEAEKGLCSMGFAAEEMTEIFMQADKNFDGQLSLKEFQIGVMPILCERMGLSQRLQVC